MRREHSKRAGEVYSAGFLLAVLPKYRTACMNLVNSSDHRSIAFWVSAAHLDPTVRTDPAVTYYRRIPMYRLGRLAFFQLIPLGAVLARSLVVDLNPRSLSVWILLAIRNLMRRRTVVWGHLNPQAGPASRTAPLRRLMRRLAQGTITYTYRDARQALDDMPLSSVWVAPNALYPRELIRASESGDRQDVIYVGRFEPAKKVLLLVEGFALARESVPTAHLTLVGGGSQEDHLRERVMELELEKWVSFEGWVDDPGQLSELYSRAFASASPGFAGLGLTQSLGFGVPQLIARFEPHSPEIELADQESCSWFDSDSPASLADAIAEAWTHRSAVPLTAVSERVRRTYSAEAMAAGLIGALAGVGTYHPPSEDHHV